MYPSVIKVTVEKDYQEVVVFDNDELGVLDMKPYLNFGVFKKLADPAVFNAIKVSFDTVEWPDGIDLDPEFVYEKCIRVPCPAKV
jgi:hypothetical protein